MEEADSISLEIEENNDDENLNEQLRQYNIYINFLNDYYKTKIQNHLNLILYYQSNYLDRTWRKKMNEIKNLDVNNFDNEISQSNKLVLVDFWAEWCAPCKALTPILEEISQENEKVQVAKVNLDENQDLAMKYSIRSIPTLLLFKDGQLLDTKVGFAPKTDLVEWLDSKT